MVDTKANFAGSIPEFYDKHLGPAWFDIFAAELAKRLPPKPPGDVLEVACGSGRVTRRLRERLDASLRLVATDLSKAMLDYAQGTLRGVSGIEWREADACKLPFGDAQFGALVCAFGIMFVPDKAAAFAEARRVLKKGGLLLFDVWDREEESAHALAYARAIEEMFPGEQELRFTVPYEMHDKAQLRRYLAAAGFQEVRIEPKRIQLGPVSARDIAIGQVRGTPRSLMYEKRNVSLDQVIERVTAKLAEVGGADPYRGTAQAIMVEARAA